MAAAVVCKMRSNGLVPDTFVNKPLLQRMMLLDKLRLDKDKVESSDTKSLSIVSDESSRTNQMTVLSSTRCCWK